MPEKGIVEETAGSSKDEIQEQEAWKNVPARSSTVKAAIWSHVRQMFRLIETPGDDRRFHEVEKALHPHGVRLG